jgi:CYTH domain-containing protein
MGVEIERRFLVTDPTVIEGREGVEVVQGYFGRIDGLSVRVRVIGAEARLTFKGDPSGPRRLEFEYAIPLSSARRALACLPVQHLVTKTRYEFDCGGKLWQVDRFGGDNAGLVIAEVELERDDEPVLLPCWVGREVTNEHRYRNSVLAVTPCPAHRRVA